MNPLSKTHSAPTSTPPEWPYSALQVQSELLSHWAESTGDFLARSAELMRLSLAATKAVPMKIAMRDSRTNEV
jgi:hypothetical protein